MVRKFSSLQTMQLSRYIMQKLSGISRTSSPGLNKLSTVWEVPLQALIEDCFCKFLTLQECITKKATIADNEKPRGRILGFFSGADGTRYKWTISSSVPDAARCRLTLVSLVSEPSPVFPGAWLLIVLKGFPAIQAVFNVMSPLRGSDIEPVSKHFIRLLSTCLSQCWFS